MKSYSQVGQDLWVLEQFAHKRDGTFLDIGAGEPIRTSNTWLLESEFGWTGLAVDFNASLNSQWDEAKRKLIVANAVELDWVELSKPFGGRFDYLSLDIDDWQLEFCQKFPWHQVSFGVMTVEHDSYRFGENFRDDIRHILLGAGYVCVRPDVTVGPVSKKPFEDWWICTQ